jgi:plastocyanin
MSLPGTVDAVGLMTQRQPAHQERRSTNRRRFLSALALLTCGANLRIAWAATKSTAHTVVIEGMQFKPALLTIYPGDSVTWVNNDIVVHTATTPASAKQRFDSRPIAVGKAWTHTLTEVGTHDYVCTYHPTMRGVVKVVAASQSSRNRRT